MKTNEVVQDTYVVGKVRQNGTMCVTEAHRQIDGSIKVTGKMYKMRPQVIKAYGQINSEEEK